MMEDGVPAYLFVIPDSQGPRRLPGMPMSAEVTLVESPCEIAVVTESGEFLFGHRVSYPVQIE
jgi:hypothetical protein